MTGDEISTRPASESTGTEGFSVISVARPAPEPILAVGGELKSAVCLLVEDQAVQSAPLGELSDAAAYRRFLATIDRLKLHLGVDPRVVACDLHPDYAATRYALNLPATVVPVQHHFAHVASCLADNNLSGRVVGIACDGTGYGTDGAIWGCEVLACDETGFERAAHLQYFPLLGGDAAAQETWRPAAGLLYETYGSDWQQAASWVLERVSPEALRIAEQRLARSTRVPKTSSLGRLFDAVAFLLGVCDRNRHEAEAPIALENLARQQPEVEPLPYTIVAGEQNGEPARLMQLDVRPMIRALLAERQAGRGTGELARAFHETVAAMLAECANRVASRAGLNRVLLTGGCFANRLLLDGVTERLRAAGSEVFTHCQVPVSDGGLALGQAVVAAEWLRRAQ